MEAEAASHTNGQTTLAPRPRGVGSVSTKRLYTLSEAAVYLGRSSHWSVRRLIWGGQLPVVRMKGRLLVDLRDMDALIEKCKDRIRPDGLP